MDYVDLLYIHQPAGNWLAGYRQLEKAYKEGKTKSIGISNFEGKYIAELKTKWEIVPQFIQVEAHPYYTQKELRETLDQYGIRLMSWYPLGHGDKSLMEEPVFAELGEKYGKSPAQVILRWHTQMGFVVIPGSKNVDHIKDNLDIMDFRMTEEEMVFFEPFVFEDKVYGGGERIRVKDLYRQQLAQAGLGGGGTAPAGAPAVEKGRGMKAFAGRLVKKWRSLTET